MEIFYNIIGWLILSCLICYTVFSIIKLVIEFQNRIKKSKKEELKKDDGSSNSIGNN